MTEIAGSSWQVWNSPGCASWQPSGTACWDVWGSAHASLPSLAGWFCRFVIYSISVLNNKSASGRETTPVCILLNHVPYKAGKPRPVERLSFCHLKCSVIFFTIFSLNLWEEVEFFDILFRLHTCLEGSHWSWFLSHSLGDHIPFSLWATLSCVLGTEPGWQQNCNCSNPSVDERDSWRLPD